MPELLANVARLRAEARPLGIPVLYTAQPGGQSPGERGLQQDFWGPGLPADAARRGIADALAPGPGDTC